MSGVGGGVVALSGYTAPNADQTVENGYQTRTGSGDVTLITVTGGKTVYIHDIQCQAFTNLGANTTGTFTFKDNATTLLVLRHETAGTARLTLQIPIAFSTSVVCSYNAALGTDVCHVSVQGFEQ